jgi:hypothetical protein
MLTGLPEIAIEWLGVPPEHYVRDIALSIAGGEFSIEVRAPYREGFRPEPERPTKEPRNKSKKMSSNSIGGRSAIYVTKRVSAKLYQGGSPGLPKRK